MKIDEKSLFHTIIENNTKMIHELNSNIRNELVHNYQHFINEAYIKLLKIIDYAMTHKLDRARDWYYFMRIHSSINRLYRLFWDDNSEMNNWEEVEFIEAEAKRDLKYWFNLS